MPASDGQTSFAIPLTVLLRSTIGSKGNMSGLQAAEVPLGSDSEADSGGTVPGRGQVLVAAEPPQVLMPWEQGIFRDIFDDRPILECSLPTPKAILPVDDAQTPQAPEVDSPTSLTTGSAPKAPRVCQP